MCSFPKMSTLLDMLKSHRNYPQIIFYLTKDTQRKPYRKWPGIDTFIAEGQHLNELRQSFRRRRQ